MNLHHYQYEAINARGKKVKKGMDAVSKLEVVEYLTAKNYQVISLKEVNHIFTKLNSINVNNVLPRKQLVFFLKQFSSLIHAGFTLTDAVKSLALQQDNKYQRRLLFDIYESLLNGDSFSTALKRYPKEFPQMLVKMIEISELSGHLAETMLEMSAYYEKQIKTRSEIIGTIRMPLIYLGITILIAIGMVLFVFPNISDLFSSFEDAELPGITVFFLAASDYINLHFLNILLIIIGLVVIIYLANKYIDAFNKAMSISLLELPIFGQLVKMYNQILIANTLSQMLSHGIQALSALLSIRGLLRNRIYKKLIDETIVNITNGEKLSKSFTKSEWIDPIMAHMIETGESTGDLPSLMKNLSEYYNDVSDLRIERIKASLQPILLIFIYTFIAIMLLAVMLPMLSLSGQI